MLQHLRVPDMWAFVVGMIVGSLSMLVGVLAGAGIAQHKPDTLNSFNYPPNS